MTRLEIRRLPSEHILVRAITAYGVGLTPDEADAAAAELQALAGQIRSDEARAVCAVEGHEMLGYDAYRSWPNEKIHIQWCVRPHCGFQETLDGWREKP